MTNAEDSSKLNRRELLATAVAAFALQRALPVLAENEPSIRSIIDTNVSLFQWPFRRLPLDNTRLLAEKLQLLGICEAWAGSFEGIFQRDLTGVNSRLVEECTQYPLFIPVGSVNPMLPGWQTDVRRCFEDHHMIGVRVHPGYHGYTLDDAEFAKLLSITAEAGRFVQVVVCLEDTRTQNELVRVPDVDLAPLIPLLRQIPKSRVQLLNYRPEAALMKQLSSLPNVDFDIARVEGTDGVPRLVDVVASERVLFGSHAPFLIPEAALIRTHESGLLDAGQLQAVLAGNPQRLRRSAT